MNTGRKFVLDANVFIQAKKEYYSFELCPGFWKALLNAHEQGAVCSIDQVRDEIVAKEDRLKVWAADDVPKTFFKKTADIKVVRVYQSMSAWVQSQSQFTPAAKMEFATVADGWVVAFAKAYGHVVVTHEVYAPDVQKKVPMPNVCLAFDVETLNTFQMLDELGVQFTLSKFKRAQS